MNAAFRICYMYFAAVSLRVALGASSGSLIFFDTVYYFIAYLHWFCLWLWQFICSSDVYGLVQGQILPSLIFFSNITRVCCKDNSVKNHFIGFLNILSPEALGRSQTVPLFRTLLVLSWETSKRKILDCILVLHDSENRSKYVLSFFLSSSVPSPQVFSMSRLFFSTPYQQITAIFSLFLWRKWAIEHEFQVLSETLLAFW